MSEFFSGFTIGDVLFLVVAVVAMVLLYRSVPLSVIERLEKDLAQLKIEAAKTQTKMDDIAIEVTEIGLAELKRQKSEAPAVTVNIPGAAQDSFDITTGQKG